MAADVHSEREGHRGLIVGELLLAVLLLAVAVSSLAALMYSVSHRSEARQEISQATGACTTAKGGTAAVNCATRAQVGGGAKLLRSPCVTQDGTPARGCNDASGNSPGSGETILKTRTDSASIALVPKKPRSAESTARPDRGFIR